MNRKEISERLMEVARGDSWDHSALLTVIHQFDLSPEERTVVKSFMSGYTNLWHDLQDIAIRIADGSIAQSCP